MKTVEIRVSRAPIDNKELKAPLKALVLGGGVAGLTAAHELSLRGFKVHVVEAALDPRTHGRPLLGGLAATQFAMVPLDATSDALATDSYNMVEAQPLRRCWVAHRTTDDLNEVVDVWARFVEEHQCQRVYVRYFKEPEWATSKGMRAERARVAAEALQARLAGRSSVMVDSSDEPHDLEDRDAFQGDDVWITFSRVLLRGEHGYRFFPSFYRHLFDTMRRTPIPGSSGFAGLQSGPYVGPSAYSALTPVKQHAIATPGLWAPSPLPRAKPGSIKQGLATIRTLLDEMGFAAWELALLSVKMTEFLGMGERRRRRLEHVSAEDHMEVRRLTPKSQTQLRNWNHALVAMRLSETDARTFLEVNTQLILDQLRDEFVDGTLSSSTTEAWLDPWRRMLRHPGTLNEILPLRESDCDVWFALGRLVRIAAGDREVVLTLETDDDDLLGSYSAVVFALPLEVVGPLVVDLPAGDRSIDDIVKYYRASTAEGRSAYADFIGIQFFFELPTDWLRGHVYLPHSEWGLSLIAQNLFRAEPQSGASLYRGLVSVVIGRGGEKGAHGKPVIGSTSREIADETLRQMRVSLEGVDRRTGLRLEVPTPKYYHIDQNIEFDEERRAIRNRIRFMMNHPALSAARPGRPREYRLAWNRAAFAGPYMPTYTRMTTMEAANESARHAVNAILAELDRAMGSSVGSRCETWTMVEREPEDMEPLRRLDDLISAMMSPRL